MEEAFGEFAVKESACPSKAQGGNLGWFPYSSMVEPFAKTAFSLKPYEISDVVTTQFGHHLILVTEHKAGKEPKFDEVKMDVKEIFVERLRESLCNQLRQSAKVVMNPPAKT
jgi:peptidyl-prolyl cis-trans isomerase C